MPTQWQCFFITLTLSLLTVAWQCWHLIAHKQQQQQQPSACTSATAPRCDQQPPGRASAGAAAAASPAVSHPAGLWLGRPLGTQALPSVAHSEAHGRLDLHVSSIIHQQQHVWPSQNPNSIFLFQAS